MPRVKKRGRPLSDEHIDPNVQRLREQARNRKKSQRRRKEAPESSSTRLQSIAEQSVEETDHTLIALGLRLESISLQPIEEEEATLQAGISAEEEQNLSVQRWSQDADPYNEIATSPSADNNPQADSFPEQTRSPGSTTREARPMPNTLELPFSPPRPSPVLDQHLVGTSSPQTQIRPQISRQEHSSSPFQQPNRSPSVSTQRSVVSTQGFFKQFHRPKGIQREEGPTPSTSRLPIVPTASPAPIQDAESLEDSDREEDLPEPPEIIVQARRRNEAAREARRREEEEGEAEARRIEQSAQLERERRQWLEDLAAQRALEAQQEADNESAEDRARFGQQHSSDDGGPSDDDMHIPTEAEILAEAEAYTVQKIAEHFRSFHGCSPDRHDEIRLEHFREQPEEHFPLQRTYQNNSFPNVMAREELLTRHSLEELGTHPSPTEWEDLFCGTNSSQEQSIPPQICLHAERTREAAASTSFDIDSFLGFPSSLAVAKNGIEFQLAPMSVHNLTTDIHINRSAIRRPTREDTEDVDADDPNPPPPRPRSQEDGEDGAEEASRLPSYRATPLKDIAHFLFGRVSSATHTTIYILFPHLEVRSHKFVAISDENLKRWFDEVLYPAMNAILEADVLQHIVSSFDHAYLNSVAHKIEGR